VTHLLRPAALGFFVLTLLIGVAMRWDFATGQLSSLGLMMPNLRHAHSHAGYYGVLTLGWWVIEGRAGVVLPRRVQLVYVSSALVATFTFAVMGYRPLTIALSTLVASVWVYAGFLHWRRRGPPAWLDVAPLGLIASVAIVPVIAVMAKRDFGFSRELAHVFITIVLLLVFVPAAWQAQGIARRVPVLVVVLLAIGAAVRVVFAERGTPIAGALAVGYAAVALWTVRSRPVWAVLPVAIVLASFVGAVQGYSFRIAGLHFLILGPVLAGIFGGDVGQWLRVAYVGSLVLMVASIAVPLSGERPVLITAIASTLFTVVALVAAVRARHLHDGGRGTNA
jgi:hypothetical protein